MGSKENRPTLRDILALLYFPFQPTRKNSPDYALDYLPAVIVPVRRTSCLGLARTVKRPSNGAAGGDWDFRDRCEKGSRRWLGFPV